MLFYRADFEAGYQDFKTRLENYEKVFSWHIINDYSYWNLSWMASINYSNINSFSCYKVYEPVEEGSYIKMIDMVKGHGGQIQVIQTALLLLHI